MWRIIDRGCRRRGRDGPVGLLWRSPCLLFLRSPCGLPRISLLISINAAIWPLRPGSPCAVWRIDLAQDAASLRISWGECKWGSVSCSGELRGGSMWGCRECFAFLLIYIVYFGLGFCSFERQRKNGFKVRHSKKCPNEPTIEMTVCLNRWFW